LRLVHDLKASSASSVARGTFTHSRLAIFLNERAFIRIAAGKSALVNAVLLNASSFTTVTESAYIVVRLVASSNAPLLISVTNGMSTEVKPVQPWKASLAMVWWEGSMAMSPEQQAELGSFSERQPVVRVSTTTSSSNSTPVTRNTMEKTHSLTHSLNQSQIPNRFNYNNE
jgi:hypothetical protein